MNYEELAQATLQVLTDNDCGSGFHFHSKETIVTNYHVIKSFIKGKSNQLFARTENGSQVDLKVVDYSSEDKYDYAILESKGEFDEDRTVLQPKTDYERRRGKTICFAGFPHGVEDLLVQTGIISGPYFDRKLDQKVGYYLDASVNGGNSGGPIVDLEDMKVVGIVTKNRFLTPYNLDDLLSKAEGLEEHYENMGGSAGVNISGIDFGEFATLMAKLTQVLETMIDANANSGIGIGYYIGFIEDSFNKSYI